VRVLLDTHAWLWAAADASRLGKRAGAILIDNKTERLISVALALEIARLAAGGEIILSMAPSAWIAQSAKLLLLDQLDITNETAIEAYALPEPFHRDPADRLLVAAARVHNLILFTADERILRYRHVRSMDCRK
jgi:PIN domain nuclease of toxin-antitoxin system